MPNENDLSLLMLRGLYPPGLCMCIEPNSKEDTSTIFYSERKNTHNETKHDR